MRAPLLATGLAFFLLAAHDGLWAGPLEEFTSAEAEVASLQASIAVKEKQLETQRRALSQAQGTLREFEEHSGNSPRADRRVLNAKRRVEEIKLSISQLENEMALEKAKLGEAVKKRDAARLALDAELKKTAPAQPPGPQPARPASAVASPRAQSASGTPVWLAKMQNRDAKAEQLKLRDAAAAYESPIATQQRLRQGAEALLAKGDRTSDQYGLLLLHKIVVSTLETRELTEAQDYFKAQYSEDRVKELDAQYFRLLELEKAAGPYAVAPK